VVGNPCLDPAFGCHQGSGAQPFHGRDCRQDGLGLAAPLDEPAREILIGAGVLGLDIEPIRNSRAPRPAKFL
jgi:hypothetical protein